MHTVKREYAGLLGRSGRRIKKLYDVSESERFFNHPKSKRACPDPPSKEMVATRTHALELRRTFLPGYESRRVRGTHLDNFLSALLYSTCEY